MAWNVRMYQILDTLVQKGHGSMRLQVVRPWSKDRRTLIRRTAPKLSSWVGGETDYEEEGKLKQTLSRYFEKYFHQGGLLLIRALSHPRLAERLWRVSFPDIRYLIWVRSSTPPPTHPDPVLLSWALLWCRLPKSAVFSKNLSKDITSTTVPFLNGVDS